MSRVLFDFDRSWLLAVPTPLFESLFWTALVLVLVVVHVVLRWLQNRFEWARIPPWLAALAAVGGLVAVEMGLRYVAQVAPSSAYSTVPGLYWTLPTNARGVTSVMRLDGYYHLPPGLHVDGSDRSPMDATPVDSNSAGLREREIPFDKAPGEFRIVCLGDSWTFGQAVRQDKTWTRDLEDELNQRLKPRHFTVVNCGMPGSTWLQGYLMLTQIGLRYQPDLVICGGFNLNRSLPPLNDLDPLDFPLRSSLRRSLVYGVLRHEMLRMMPTDSSSWTSDDYAQRVAELLARHNIPALYFDHVMRSASVEVTDADVGDNVPLKELPPNQRSVSLHPSSFRGPATPFMLELDDKHPSEFGDKEIARVVADLLISWGIVTR